MIYSMTAFASAELPAAGDVLGWELRSVNHRYAEVSVRLPEALRSFESGVREMIAGRIRRGKVDAVCRLREKDEVTSRLSLNLELVKGVLKACADIEHQMDNPARINVLEVMRWPGVLRYDEPLDIEVMRLAVNDSLSTALDELLDNRLREGQKITVLLEQRCQAIAEQVTLVRGLLPDILSAQRQRLLQRFDELNLEIDKQRLEQEMVYLAQKTDVQEELDRLDVHIGECRQVLQQSAPAGRRLDFLMQEFNREINTLASKSISADLTKAAVEMKVLVEQMREQIQNVE